MASTKGIAITAAIVVGVVGASMLVWFGPQENFNVANFSQEVTADNINDLLSSYAFGSIYNRHQNVDAELEFDYSRWKAGDTDSSRMLQSIAGARSDVAEMNGAFDAAMPPQEWQASFDHYTEALEIYARYLDEMERIVRAGDTNPNETTLNMYRQNYEEQVELAASAIPVS